MISSEIRDEDLKAYVRQMESARKRALEAINLYSEGILQTTADKACDINMVHLKKLRTDMAAALNQWQSSLAAVVRRKKINESAIANLERLDDRDRKKDKSAK